MKSYTLQQVNQSYAALLARAEKQGDCSVITTGLDRGGYCRVSVWIKGKNKGTTVRGHVIAYMAKERTTDLGGLHVLHTCDTPNCINQNHLWLGTHQDNMEDMAMKDRAPGLRGSLNGSSLLTEHQVTYAYTSLDTVTTVASVLGVSPSTIFAIRNGQNWEHLTQFLEAPTRESGNSAPRKLSTDDITAIFLSEESTTDLMTLYPISRVQINAIRRGAVHASITKDLGT